jgi:GDPmannose 4,6-dehydratase
MKKKALIFGISGQDGSFLTSLLIKKKYIIFGTTRSKKKYFKNFQKLNINKNDVKIFQVNHYQKKKIELIIRKTKCNEIYFFSGISSVSKSFELEDKTIESNVTGLINIIQAVEKVDKNIKIFNPISTDCFGSQKKPINEKSKFNPSSPYALSKAMNFYIGENYKNNLNMWISSSFLSNHNSLLRNDQFIFGKITKYIKNIKKNKTNKLLVGNIDIERDWGWAPEFANFMHLIMRSKKPENYVIGTGKTTSLRLIIDKLFRKYNYDYRKYIKKDKKLIRPLESMKNSIDPSLLKKRFKKTPNVSINQIINNLVQNNLKQK